MFSFTRSRSWSRLRKKIPGAAPKQTGSETLVTTIITSAQLCREYYRT